MGYIARPYPKKLNQGLVIKTHRNHHNFVRTKDKKTGPLLNNKISSHLQYVKINIIMPFSHLAELHAGQASALPLSYRCWPQIYCCISI